MSASPNIRLPGVYFLPPPRVVPPGLPPLDVAGFVGFAERGPLDTPVPVEDIGVYSAVFGGDKPLARDEEGGTVYAYLPTSVTGFFANGGRRCWVVRVAGPGATRTRMSVPGLISLGGLSSPRLASIRASSEGRWSERLKLAALLDVTPMPAAAFQVLSGNRVEWSTGSAPEAIRSGDLLRFAFPDGNEWLFAVASLITPPNSTPGTPVVINAGNSWRLVTAANPSLPAFVNQIQLLTLDGRQLVGATGDLRPQDRQLELHMAEAGVVTPDQRTLSSVAPGDALRLELADGRKLLFPVTALKHSAESGSPGQRRLIASTDRALELGGQPLPVVSPPVLRRVERLRLELHIKDGSDRRALLLDLGFNAAHPRFWGQTALLESSPLYQRSTVDQEGEAAAQAATLFRQLRRDTLTDPGSSSVIDVVALAGLLSPIDEDEKSLTFLPLGMPQVLVEDDFIRPLPDEVGRDDLLTLDPRLFVDPYLVRNIEVQTSGSALMAEAFNRVYVQNRRLKGLHSLMFVDEVALLALPDTVQRGWEPIKPGKPAPPPVASPPSGPPVDQLDPALFIDCVPPDVTGIKPAAGPLAGDEMVEITGRGFIERGTDISFAGHAATGIEVLCSQLLRCVTPPMPTVGLVSVEVTTPNGSAIKPDAFSYESAPEEILPRPLLLQETNIDALIKVQQAAINFCRARTDLVSILTLPLHFEKRDAIFWLESLREKLGLPKRGSVFDDVRDIADLSYAAVYHPWALITDSNASDQLRSVPSDGIICGVIAAREHQRGVWVAPANSPLNGLIGLALDISTDDWADLFNLQFNLIRREPRDFRAMSAHTLSDRRDLLQVSVRRLMIQLRKAAMELGMDYVFRPNNEHFREAVRMAIEGLLKSMFVRGAFAGTKPEDSYRVTTDASVNTRESTDQGRFIARIQVAPSEPMEFITVLLSRVGENLLEATEV